MFEGQGLTPSNNWIFYYEGLKHWNILKIYLKSIGDLLSWPSWWKWEARLADLNESLSFIRWWIIIWYSSREKTTKFLFNIEINFFNLIRGVEYVNMNHLVCLWWQDRQTETIWNAKIKNFFSIFLNAHRRGKFSDALRSEDMKLMKRLGHSSY